MKLLQSNSKWVRLTIHVLIWAVVFFLPYLLDSPGPRHATNAEQQAFLYLRLSSFIFWVPLFYLNSEVLTPRLIYPKKIFLYTAILVLIFSLLVFVHGLLFHWLISGDEYSLARAIRFNLPTFTLTLAIGVLYRLSWDKVREDDMLHRIQEENLKTELAFLRSQISPHFVFNVLNNIVAMVRLRHDRLEETVIKLSSLMQYMLYEAEDEKVLLKREAEYLQSYIDLQQQRFGAKVRVNADISLSEEWYEIEPMLLIPFVENAFKHGVGMIAQPQIDIRLRTEGKTLFFTVENKFSAGTGEIKDKTSGIGLTNVKRRLNLLYAESHTLRIAEENGWFKVSLQLNLHA